MQTPIAFYEEKIQQYGTELQLLQKRSLLVSGARLVSFLALAWSIWQWAQQGADIYKIATGGFLVLFILFIRIALTLSDKKKLLEKLLFLNRNELGILQYEPNQFSNGVSFTNNDNYSGDLDIFGANSVYHLLNRTTTHHGTQALAGLLQQSLLGKEAIEQQQQAVRSLSTQKELRQLITAHGLLHDEKEGNLHDVASWLRWQPILQGKKWPTTLRLLVPALNVGSLVFV
ncbi:hypothetical protein [Paraflavitalea speifideaquila]|uniref:hypothetical protein n=1 Tax=Paraflavitalea speifideaquila TaxID=3076558 RepID=UPI0028F0BBEE|nr:hypothetical protein [Paraflavitalea speifideiaquila]